MLITNKYIQPMDYISTLTHILPPIVLVLYLCLIAILLLFCHLSNRYTLKMKHDKYSDIKAKLCQDTKFVFANLDEDKRKKFTICDKSLIMPSHSTINVPPNAKFNLINRYTGDKIEIIVCKKSKFFNDIEYTDDNYSVPKDTLYHKNEINEPYNTKSERKIIFDSHQSSIKIILPKRTIFTISSLSVGYRNDVYFTLKNATIATICS